MFKTVLIRIRSLLLKKYGNPVCLMLLLGDEEVCKTLGTLNTQFIGRDKDRVK